MEATPTLAEIQSRLSACILGQQPLSTSAGALEFVERWLTPATRQEALERLAVYVDGYPARLREALCEAFPAIVHVIGDREMSALVRRFAAVTRLRSYNLNDAGADLPRLLRDAPIAGRLPFLGDLAELEWRVLRSFHAADGVQLDPSSLTAWDEDAWSRARLRFQPWVAVVSSDWPILEIWESRETPLDEIDIDLQGKTSHVVVRRQGLSVICESVDAAEAQALHLLLGGLPLGMVMETLGASGTAAESISRWFQRWMGLGMIAAVRL